MNPSLSLPISNILRHALVMLCAFLLAACGGGGGAPLPATGGGGNTATPVGNGTIKLALVDSAGATKNMTSLNAPLVARATVKDDGGSLVKNRLVTFTLNNALATLSPIVGTALTDDTGVAQVTVTGTANGEGASEITASVQLGTVAVTDKAAFSVAKASLASGNGSIKLVLTDASGAPKNQLSISSPLLARATVTDDAGAPLANRVVTFSGANLGAIALANLSPAATVLTDSAGIAQVTLQSAGNAGASELVASVQIGTAAVAARAAYSAAAAPSAKPAAINFVTVVPNTGALVLKGTGGNGRTEVALLTFKVVDINAAPIPNVSVNFATDQAVSLASSSGVTDTSGQVTVALSSGTTPTTVRVVATVPGTSISTVSDLVTVVSGQPVQSAFAISLSQFAVEGQFTYGGEVRVTAFLGDGLGGTVPDGTAVVFTTNSGAIVGDIGARCLTVKGSCQVIWRAQAPTSPNGVVVINATTTSGVSTLTATNWLYSTGSYATIKFVRRGSTPATTVELSQLQALPGFTNCASQTATLEIVDEFGNPMPSGSTLTFTGLRNLSLSASGNSVLGNPTFVDASVLHRGSMVDVTITPLNCVASSSKTANAEFGISVQTPSGKITTTTFRIGTFPYNSDLIPQ